MSTKQQQQPFYKRKKKSKEEFEFFNGDHTKHKNGQCHTVNEVLFVWYKECARANVFPDGQMLQEKAVFIKEQLNNTDGLCTFFSLKWLASKVEPFVWIT